MNIFNILKENNWLNENELNELTNNKKIKLLIKERTTPFLEEDIFSAFDGLTPQKVKVLIIGQDPYPDVERADGMAFSFKDGKQKSDDSLKHIFENLQKAGYKNEYTSLKNWKKQGVLLLNSALTFKKEKTKNEQQKTLKTNMLIWQPFITKIIEKLIATKEQQKEPFVVMLWGKKANEIELFKNEKEYKNIKILRASHPCSMSYKRPVTSLKFCGIIEPFCECNHFTQCNKLLKNNKINWSTK